MRYWERLQETSLGLVRRLVLTADWASVDEFLGDLIE